jgi:hypothetical protein
MQAFFQNIRTLAFWCKTWYDNYMRYFLPSPVRKALAKFIFEIRRRIAMDHEEFAEEIVEENIEENVEIAEPVKPPFFSKKALIVLIASASVLLAAVAVLLVALLPSVLSPRERQAVEHVETLKAALHVPESLQLTGSIVTITIDETHLGRSVYVFIPHRAQGSHGIVQRGTAVLRNGAFIGNVGDTAAANEVHLMLAQRAYESYRLRMAQAVAEERAFEPNPDWQSFSTVSAERIAGQLGLGWQE